jgi:hypothetical protein
MTTIDESGAGSTGTGTGNDDIDIAADSTLDIITSTETSYADTTYGTDTVILSSTSMTLSTSVVSPANTSSMGRYLTQCLCGGSSATAV